MVHEIKVHIGVGDRGRLPCAKCGGGLTAREAASFYLGEANWTEIKVRCGSCREVATIKAHEFVDLLEISEKAFE